ncbi:MAG TPA: hypothetical protein VN026_11035 [Bacteroidia bacterium]|jgi:hypothetical protein|nr:hypothetical protein [Bacteroidia bacterium]
MDVFIANYTKLNKGVKRIIIALTLIPISFGIAIDYPNLGVAFWLSLVYWGMVLIVLWVIDGFKKQSNNSTKDRIEQLEAEAKGTIEIIKLFDGKLDQLNDKIEKLESSLCETDEMVSGTNDRLTDCFLELENKLKKQ